MLRFIAASISAALVSLAGAGAEGPTPKCPGMPEGARCWIEAADKPGCYLFDPYYDPPEIATWSGACAGGVAVGRGIWGWTSSSDSGEGTGVLVGGKMHGRWVLRYAGGGGSEGPFVDGKRHGRWVYRYADGDFLELEFRDGSREGQPGVYITENGARIPGRWSRGCFRDAQGNWHVSDGEQSCGSE